MSRYLKIILLLTYFLTKCSLVDSLLTSQLSEINEKIFMWWPNATVPFYINPEHFDHEQAMAIMTALSMFAFKTCIKFAPVMAPPDENQHVMVFINPDGIKRCRIIAKGHSNFHPHLITLGYECLQSPEIDMIIMRALGFSFEHNRMSRDVYVNVMVENIEPSYVELFTKDSVLPPALRSLPYDVNSVMHFGEREYSKNGHRTILFKDHKVRQHRKGLSATDIRKIELIYGPECRARDRQEKIELCQSYPGVARKKREAISGTAPDINLRVNRDITPPPKLSTHLANPVALAAATVENIESEYFTQNFQDLGIVNETEDIVEQVYKLSALALKNAREKYCNVTSNSTSKFTFDKIERKHTNTSDILGVLEVIGDYAKSMVENAIKNLTVFCQQSESVETYQRQCNWNTGAGCPQSYKSTKSGAVRYSTKHRPYIKQQTKHDGYDQRHAYERRKSGDGPGTPSFVGDARKKREVTVSVAPSNPTEEAKEQKTNKEKTKKEKSEVSKENAADKTKSDETKNSDSKTKDLKRESRRFFKERSNKKSQTIDSENEELTDSNVFLNKDKAKKRNEGKQDTMDQDNYDNDTPEQHREIESEAQKVIDKEKLVKEVLHEGLEKTIDKTLNTIKTESKESVKKLSSDEEKDREEENLNARAEQSEEVSVEKTAEETDIETTTHKKKRHKIIADYQNFESYVEKDEESRPKKKRQKSQRWSDFPETVKLNKLNEEFYNERKWPDGVIRFVIKKLPDYDLEDLRDRLAEVNSILLKKTCVQMKEIDESEADGYDDVLILDNSPDYVTGKVGGKQIFGCVELFRGGQHRQHTAMMVMAMLGFYFEVSRHDRDRHIRVHMRHIRPDKLHHFEKIRDEATLDIPYDYRSATHPAWQFWRKIGKTGISTVATYKEQDPDGSIMRGLGQHEELLSKGDIIKINSIYGVDCFERTRASDKVEPKRLSEVLQ